MTKPTWTARVSSHAGMAAETGRQMAGSAAHYVGAPGMWESVSKSGLGQAVGNNKVLAGTVAIGATAVAAMAYRRGKHAEQQAQRTVARGASNDNYIG